MREHKHLCPKCLKDYKRGPAGRAARRTGVGWGKSGWPEHLYHYGPNRLCERHSAQHLAYGAARRATKLNATPPWADRAAIKSVYAEAARLTRETGTKHHVDHILPLRGAAVTGLHVHTNLRPLPAGQNMKKGNRYAP